MKIEDSEFHISHETGITEGILIAAIKIYKHVHTHTHIYIHTHTTSDHLVFFSTGPAYYI